MLYHLEATDPDYLDMIHDGSYVPMKIVPFTTDGCKVVLNNYLLSCKSAKKMLDKLQVHCEDTKPCKNNIRSFLIQEYVTNADLVSVRI